MAFASSFAMFAAGRGFEQVRNSSGYTRLNVKIGVAIFFTSAIAHRLHFRQPGLQLRHGNLKLLVVGGFPVPVRVVLHVAQLRHVCRRTGL